MTVTTFRRIALILAVLALISPLPGIIDHPGAPAAVADEHKDESDENGGEDDGNRGHGNDPDGFDEDNPGRDGGKDKDKDTGDNEGENGGADAGQPDPVVTVDPYTVEVTCEYDAEAEQTACSFAGVAPEGTADVSHVDVPEEIICAEVVSGEYEYVDPDPNTRVTGYKSRGSEGELTLVLAGEVATGDPTTYWIKSGEGVFPAEGPSLQCDLAAAKTTGDEPVQASFDSTPAPETGSLAIRAYTCTGVPDDTSAFDWFGACDPAGSGLPMAVTPAGTTSDPIEAETGQDGAVTIDGLAAGAYTVDFVDGAWCEAKSDSVNADSEVIVEAAATSTVWIFTCNNAKSGA